MGTNLVLLIQPATSSQLRSLIKEKYDFPPIGLLYLAGMLLTHGYEVRIIDLLIENYTRQSLAAELRKLGRPLLAGLTCYTDSARECLEVATLVKQVYPETKLAMGGPHATFCYEELLASPAVDFVCRREGEATIIELLEHIKYGQAFPAEEIAGLCHRDQTGSIRVNPDREFVHNLDNLPLPPYGLLRGEFYATSFPFVASRGCPGDCVFCSSRALSGKRYRGHSAEWLFSLVYDRYQEKPFRLMVSLDDTFTAVRRRVKRFCQYIQTHLAGKVVWACKSRVDILDEDLVATLVQAGCRSVHIGVESGDQRVLDGIAKHITLDQVFQAIRLLRRHGIRPDCSLIIGHYCDTLESIEKTLILAAAIRDANLASVALAISTPFPGTPIYNQPKAYGLEIFTRDWRRYDLFTPVFTARHYTPNDLRRGLKWLEVDSRAGKRLPGLTTATHQTWRLQIEDFIASVQAGEEQTAAGEGQLDQPFRPAVAEKGGSRAHVG